MRVVVALAVEVGIIALALQGAVTGAVAASSTDAAAEQHRSSGVHASPSSRSVSTTTARRRVRSSSNSLTINRPCRAVSAQCTCRIGSPARYSRIPR